MATHSTKERRFHPAVSEYQIQLELAGRFIKKPNWRKKHKREAINKLCRLDEAYLRRHNAWATGSKGINYDSYMFAANYIRRRSRLAPLIKHLGLEKEIRLINRHWKKLQGIRFYKMIYFIACLQENYYSFESTGEYRNNFALETLRNNPAGYEVYNYVREKYYAMRADVRATITRAKRVTKTYSNHDIARLASAINDYHSTGCTPSKPGCIGWTICDVWFTLYLGDVEKARSMVQYNVEHHPYGDFAGSFLFSAFWRDPFPYLKRNGIVLNKTYKGEAPEEFYYVFGVERSDMAEASAEYEQHSIAILDRMRKWQDLPSMMSLADESENFHSEDEDHITTELDKVALHEHTQETIMEEDVTLSGSVVTVPEKVSRLASALSKIHGPVSISREASGHHIYIADPELLHKDGKKELNSRHLAINADKYFGIGDYDIDDHPTPENRKLYKNYYSKGKEVACATSMKTKRVYMVSELLQYLPLDQRELDLNNIKATVVTSSVSKRLVRDKFGNLVPEWPGEVVPLSKLDRRHPAIEYLENRGFNVNLLEEQFECGYCTKALPESRGEGRYYSRLPGGMRNSPGGRIVFSCRMDGVRWGWQARVIDKWVGDSYYVWSDREQWILVRQKLPDGSAREMFPPNESFPKGLSPHKYLNAPGAERNKMLMGYDAAVQHMMAYPYEHRFCFLVEGPLDAGKLGVPAMALLGKSMSPMQASAIRKQFSKVYTLMDNDESGRQCFNRICDMLPSMPIINIPIPEPYKDVGDMSYQEVFKLTKDCWKR